MIEYGHRELYHQKASPSNACYNAKGGVLISSNSSDMLINVKMNFKLCSGHYRMESSDKV